MRRRNNFQLERELTAYKYLCLFVLGFALGYFVGGAI
jgi:hypothetical protein|tara:strand:+ start:595 stop:705 length:111 start_codon:yes stop_codon:yes gene_type:complete